MPSETPPETMPTAAEAGERLHPLSLVFGVGTAVWALLAFLLFSGAGANSCLVVLFIPPVLVSVVKYLSFRFWLGPDEMVIREGILRRNERHIPYARIQNIDLIQNPLHRLFKVGVVRLETASGGKPEAVISVLTLPTVEEMRARVFRRRDGGEPEEAAAGSPDAGGPLLELSLKELAIFGAISNKGLVMVAAILGLASQAGVLEKYSTWLESTLGEQASKVQLPELPSTLTLVLLLAAALVALVVALRLFSILWAMVKFYAFRLEQRRDDLRAEYGLLTKVSATIPRHRIQLVTVILSPLHRFADRVSVQVDTAGGGGADSNQRGSVQERQWLAPLIPRRRVLALLRRVMPEARLEAVDWRPISPRAWRRLFRRWLALLVLLIVPSLLLAGAAGVALLAAGLLLAFIHAQLWARRTGYALTPAAVLYRSGAWRRRLSVVPFAKIQVLGFHQTPFDRRHRMASVHVDTAGASVTGHQVAIGYLETDTAREVLERLDLEVGRTEFKW